MWAILAAGGLSALAFVLVAVLLLPSWLESLGGQGRVAPGDAGLVGPEGGEIAGSGGARVIVPQGALAGPVSIEIVDAPSSGGAPPDAVPAGPAYQVTVSEGDACLGPLEVVLPLEREAGSDGASYAVYGSDGSGWHSLGGVVEGDRIRARVDPRTLLVAPASAGKRLRAMAPAGRASSNPAYLQAFRQLGSGTYRTIAFVNQGAFSPWILPWVYETDRGTDDRRCLPAYGGWSSSKPGGPYYPHSWAWMRLPLGTYSSWCIEWWDHDEKVFFHTILQDSVTLDPATCTRYEHENGACEIPRVDYALPAAGGGEQGRCGAPPAAQEPSPPAATPVPATANPTLPPAAPAATPTRTPAVTPDERDIVVTLIWNSTANLDLVVYDPSGGSVGNEFLTSPSGGRLEENVNQNCATATTTPQETIYWPAGSAPAGRYRIVVLDFSVGACSADSIDFRVIAEVDGEIVLDQTGTVVYPDMPYYDVYR